MKVITLMAIILMVASCVESPSTTGANDGTANSGRNFAALPMEQDDSPKPAFDPQLVSVHENGRGALLPPPQVRNKIRLDVLQLKASISQATGGVNWVDKNGKDRWAAYLGALSVPDYEYTTQEDLSVTLMYDKLLGDAARDICPALLEKDVAAAPEERVFLMKVTPTDTYKSAPEQVKANISRLLLRYHGRKVDPNDPKMEHWRFMVESTMHFSNDPVSIWTAVCVALITHPDFSGY